MASQSSPEEIAAGFESSLPYDAPPDVSKALDALQARSIFVFGTLRDDVPRCVLHEGLHSMLYSSCNISWRSKPHWAADFYSSHPPDKAYSAYVHDLQIYKNSKPMSIPYPASRWGGGGVAIGRLLQWNDAAAFDRALAAADIVESCEPSTTAQNNLYHRHGCQAWTLSQGRWRGQPAWVYVFARDVAVGSQWAPVPSNDWLFQRAVPLKLSLSDSVGDDVSVEAASAALLRPATAAVLTAGGSDGDGAGDTTPPIAVIPGKLFISSELQAKNEAVLRGSGITHVVTLTEHAVAPESVHCLHLPAPDDDSASLQQYVVHALPYIQRVIQSTQCPVSDSGSSEPGHASQGGGVLVHCSAGISRSASVILLHLMQVHGTPLGQAWLQLRKVKPNVQPSLHFFRQLCQWEADWLGAPSANWHTYALLCTIETLTGWAADQGMKPSAYASLLKLPPADATQLLPGDRQAIFARAAAAAEASNWDLQQAIHALFLAE